MLIERIQQQLRIITNAHRHFGVCESNIVFRCHEVGDEYRFMHDHTHMVLSIIHGTSDSTDTRFVVIRNHVTGVGFVYTNVDDKEFDALLTELPNEYS